MLTGIPQGVSPPNPQPIRKIAATAFKALLARIRYPNSDPREIYLKAPLVARHSA